MATPALVPAFEVEEGSPHPLGATIQPNGVNFSLYSSSATGVELLLFDKHDSPVPLQVIRLIPSKNKTFHFWHVFVRSESRSALWLSCEWPVRARGWPPSQSQQGPDRPLFTRKHQNAVETCRWLQRFR